MDELRLATYNRLLSSVHQKIKFASTQSHANQMTHFDVPEWQPGCPRYDVKDCILYLVWNLRHSGFQVLYLSPNRLLISWREQSIKYYQEESPIRQAMIAAAATQPTAAPAAAAPKQEKKKAAAYRPAAEGVAALLAGNGTSRKATSTTVTFI
jgi:hypothetical protein